MLFDDPGLCCKIYLPLPPTPQCLDPPMSFILWVFIYVVLFILCLPHCLTQSSKFFFLACTFHLPAFIPPDLWNTATDKSMLCSTVLPSLSVLYLVLQTPRDTLWYMHSLSWLLPCEAGSHLLLQLPLQLASSAHPRADHSDLLRLSG